MRTHERKKATLAILALGLMVVVLASACSRNSQRPHPAQGPANLTSGLVGNTKDGIVAVEVSLDPMGNDQWQIAATIRNLSNNQTVDLMVDCSYLIRLDGVDRLAGCDDVVSRRLAPGESQREIQSIKGERLRVNKDMKASLVYRIVTEGSKNPERLLTIPLVARAG